MTDDLIFVRNVDTGQVGYIKRSLFEHEFFNPGILEEAEDDAKPYADGLFRSRYNNDDFNVSADEATDKKDED